MKKIELLVCIGLVLVLLTGCFGNENNNNNDNEKTSGEVNNNVLDSNFSMGTWNDNNYTNDYLDININLPESWVHYSDEEIADTMDLSQDFSQKNEYLKKVSELVNAYFVIANDPDTGNNFSIVTNKPIIDTTAEEYINNTESQLSSFEDASYEVVEKSTITLNGAEYYTLEVKSDLEAVTLSQKYYVRMLEDNKTLCVIIATAYDREGLQNVEQYFN